MAESKKENKPKHEDYGRYLHGARKELFKGTFDLNNYASLSEDEIETFINKRNLWNKIDYQKMYDNNFSVFSALLTKTIKDSLETSYNMKVKILEDVEANKRVNMFIYAFGVVGIRTVLETNNVEANNKTLFLLQKMTELGILFPVTNTATSTSDYFDVLRKMIHRERPDFDFDGTFLTGEHILKEELLKTFPEYADELNKYDDVFYHKCLRDHLGHTFARDFNNYYGPFKQSMMKADKKQHTTEWTDLIGKGNVKLITEMAKKDELDLAGNLKLLGNAKLRLGNFGLTTVQIENSMQRPQFSALMREGYDFVGDKTITASDLHETFGFNGVQWGSSISKNHKEQQITLDLTYMSLADLAQVLDIPAKSVGLEDISGRNLAIAYASQGKRKTKAHFNPYEQFIHLNRSNSAGSLAHEWFHAYDNALFFKAVNEKVLDNELLMKMQSESVDTRLLTKVINHVLKKKKYNEIYQNAYDRLCDFDMGMVKIVEAFQEKPTRVFDENDLLSNPFFDNHFVNAHKRVNQFIELFDTSLSQFKKDISNLSVVHNSYLDAGVEGMDKLISIKNNRNILNTLLNRYFDEESPYYDCLSNDSTFDFKARSSEVFDELNKVINDIRVNYYTTDYLQEKRQNFYEVLETLFSDENHYMKKHSESVLAQVYEEVKKEYLGEEYSENKISNMAYKMVNKLYDNELHEKWIENLKESVDDMPPIFRNRIKNGLDTNRANVINIINNHLADELKPFVCMSLLRDGHKIKIQENNPFLENAKMLDGQMMGSYYSTVEEMFARTGETIVGNSVKNTFLSKFEKLRASDGLVDKNTPNYDENYIVLYGQKVNPYPQGKQLEELTGYYQQSIKKHCPNGFDINLENRPIIHNQFDVIEKTIEKPKRTTNKKII